MFPASRAGVDIAGHGRDERGHGRGEQEPNACSAQAGRVGRSFEAITEWVQSLGLDILKLEKIAFLIVSKENVLWSKFSSPCTTCPLERFSFACNAMPIMYAWQVRPGMDLSKVTLPTFILEPRSFLEKLADYYFHADLLATYAPLLPAFHA
jgi:hypothetical protein